MAYEFQHAECSNCGCRPALGFSNRLPTCRVCLSGEREAPVSWKTSTNWSSSPYDYIGIIDTGGQDLSRSPYRLVWAR